MNHIAVFARRPVPGQAKTRLSPSLPAALAAQLHSAMVEDALAAAAGAGADRVTLYWDTAFEGQPGVHLPAGVTIAHQRGPDLGARLAAAFAELLEGDDRRAVVIGTDCPDLGCHALRGALVALSDSDLVLGPAEDGGYYLIGLRRPVPALFAGVTWGSHRVFEETLARARRLGLRVSSLEPLEDLDTPADLVRFIARRCAGESSSGLATESALRAIGLLPARD